MPYPKPCKRCGERFQPDGTASRLCLKCWHGVYHRRRKINEGQRKETEQETKTEGK